MRVKDLGLCLYLLSKGYFEICFKGFISAESVTFLVRGSCSIFSRLEWGHWSLLSLWLDWPFLFHPIWSPRAVLYTAVTREHDSGPANGTCFLNEVWSFVMYFRGHSLTLFCLSWTRLLWQSCGIQNGLYVPVTNEPKMDILWAYMPVFTISSPNLILPWKQRSKALLFYNTF